MFVVTLHRHSIKDGFEDGKGVGRGEVGDVGGVVLHQGVKHLAAGR